MPMGKVLKTNLSVEEIEKIIFIYLEYHFLGKLKKEETKKQENTRRNFFKKVSENVAHNLIKNDTSIPIIDYEFFSKIIDESGVYNNLGINEKEVFKETKEHFFLEWYTAFFPVKKIYNTLWMMLLSAEYVAKKENLKPVEIINDMFPINPPNNQKNV